MPFVSTGDPAPGPILRDNHYGWFDRVKTGYYDLSPKGRRELVHWSGAKGSLVLRSDVGSPGSDAPTP